MRLFSRIIILAVISISLFTVSCSYNDRNDVPDSAGGDGRGDATNTTRYQNRSMK